MKYHKQMFYFETEQVQPGAEDADRLDKVLAYDGCSWISVKFYKVERGSCYTHWMQMPKDPDEKDQEF